MAKPGKRIRALRETVERDAAYPLTEALDRVRQGATAKFDESVEAAINLGVSARRAEQNVRGVAQLPHGTGKTVRVAVFASGDQAEAAREAGADAVGHEDLAERIKQGDLDFQVCIATPASMPLVGQVGRILGPRGLMPNPKLGTVTEDTAEAVRAAKSGQVKFRIDKAGVIHCLIGKASFSREALEDNLNALLDALMRAKPAAAKGQYIRRVSVSSTMGLGVRIERQSLAAIRT